MVIHLNYKLAFIQAILPDNETTIVKPPIWFPFSNHCIYWKPQKSLYGLCHAPCHWYDMFLCILQSPEIRLQPCPHDPCIFYVTPIPAKPVSLWCYLCKWPHLLQSGWWSRTVLLIGSIPKNQSWFFGDAEWYIGIRCRWLCILSSVTRRLCCCYCWGDGPLLCH